MHTYLTQRELAARWRISERTLEGWRFRGVTGPNFLRIGRSVRYPREAVDAFEQANLHEIIASQRRPERC